MPDLPSGTLTLLFTDTEGSTSLLHRFGDRYAELLATQRSILRAAFNTHAGYEVDTQGDAFFVVFPRATQALAAAVAAQQALEEHPWPAGSTMRVRMGLHTGEPLRTAEGYTGPDVVRGARIGAAGHGGQVLLSQATADLVQRDLPPGVELEDLGEHRFKGFLQTEHVYQLLIPGLPDLFPPLKSLDSHPNNLPRQLTPLIGRVHEIQTIGSLLLQDDRSLLTITGPGGIGKTRLSLRVAAELVDEFRDGVFVVSLAPITDPALVLSTIAQTFNLQESESRRLRETVTDYLRAKQMLLVLDNFEQVPGAAPLLAELLSACPRLKLLVTSRSPLHLRGEQEVVLPPLGLPGPQHLPSIEDLRQSEAVQLFVERARAVRLDFALSDENATVVAEICRRLDGLPLAIELAAARVKLLPPQALLRRLAHQLPVLTGGARDLPARQQTLRATIGWSYDLLNAREQLMFRGLSVFVGGCSLEAAEAIADVVDGEQGIETRDGSFAPDTLDLVASLVDKNLLGQEERQGEPRFVLLETIREYGLEQLDEHGDTTAFQRRHAEYYLVLAEAAEPRLRTREQASAFELLGREHDNLRAALRWFEEQGEAGAELRLAGALAWFWFLRGHWNEGAAWLEAGLAIPGPAPAAARAKALAGAGLLTAYLGGSATAEARVMESVTLWRQLDDRAGIAASQLVRGLVASRLGDQVAPRAAWEESLAMYRMLGDQWGIAEALNYLGTLARRTGEYAMARGLLQECLAIARQAGLRSEVAWSLDMLGTLAVEDHDYAAARSLYDESLAIRRELGLRPSVGSSLGRLGDLARRQGDYTTAQTLLREGLALSWELGNWQTAALCLLALAGVMLGQGQPEHAVRLYGATEAERERLAVPLQPLYRTEYEDAVPRVRARLGEERFAAAWAAGRAMSLEQAVAYALEEPARPV